MTPCSDQKWLENDISHAWLQELHMYTVTKLSIRQRCLNTCSTLAYTCTYQNTANMFEDCAVNKWMLMTYDSIWKPW